MKPLSLVSLSLLSIGLALSVSTGLADDQTAPPATPANPPTTPGDGSQPAPTPAPQHHKHMRPGYVLEDLTEKLSLTADQQKGVGAIIESSHTQAKAIQEDDSLSKEDKHSKMRAIMGSTRDQIRAALTPDQQKLFDAMPMPGARPRNTDNN